MAIKSRTSHSQQVFDALTLSSEITVRDGNPRQMYSAALGTFEDDRRYVPCILGGFVFVSDPAGVMNGVAQLTDIEWYTQLPIENDYVTGRITNPSAEILEDTDVIDPDTGAVTHEALWRSADFLISDGSDSPWCSNVPKDCLIIHKNMPADTSMTIYGVLKFIDQRTGDIIRRLESKDIGTSGFNDEATVLRGPSGAEIMIDALAIPDAVPAGQTILDIPWTQRISVQLVGAEGNVPDTEACYQWVVEDSDAVAGWRAFSELEIAAMRITGENTKSLTYDARMITTETIRMRCFAARREEGEAWSSPIGRDNPFYDYRVTAELNGKLTADPVQLRGAVQDPGMSKQVEYTMDLRYNGKAVPARKKCLFLVHWFSSGRVLRNGSYVYERNDMGYGPKLMFFPCDYGYTYADGFMVNAEVETYKGCAVVMSSNSYVRQGDNIVIAPTYD